MTRTFAVVPVRNQSALTIRLLSCLVDEPVDDVLITDNGSTDNTVELIRFLQRHRTWQGRLHVHAMPTATIYEQWNYGFSRALQRAKREQSNVLILNNDIQLPAGWVTRMSVVLRDASPDLWATYPDYHCAWDAPADVNRVTFTRGVYGDGGMFGPCFMLAGDRITWTKRGKDAPRLPLITDLGYRWWWGDNHLAESIEQEGGLQGRVVGLPILHDNEATAQHHPELAAQKRRDRDRWIDRYNRAPRAIDRR